MAERPILTTTPLISYRMNVHVPGQPGVDPDVTLDWWWVLISIMTLYCIVAVIFGKRYGLI